MEFRVQVQSGKGTYWKSIEDLYVSIDGKEIKMSDLYDDIKKLRLRCERLENEIKNANDSHKKVEDVLTGAIELLTRKVARLESLVKE